MTCEIQPSEPKKSAYSSRSFFTGIAWPEEATGAPLSSDAMTTMFSFRSLFYSVLQLAGTGDNFPG